MLITSCTLLRFFLSRATSSTAWVSNPQATPDCIMWPTAMFANYVCHIQIQDTLSFKMHPTFKRAYPGEKKFCNKIHSTIHRIYYSFSKAMCSLRKVIFSKLEKWKMLPQILRHTLIFSSEKYEERHILNSKQCGIYCRKYTVT